MIAEFARRPACRCGSRTEGEHGTSAITVRRVGPDEWAVWRELRLAALADAPDAFGSSLAAEQDYDEATWRDLLHPGRGLRAVAFAPDPVGIVGAHHSTEVSGMVKLTGMWVRPTARGTGVRPGHWVANRARSATPESRSSRQSR